MIAKAITGKMFETFITGNMLVSGCFSRELSVSLHRRGDSSAATDVGVSLQFLTVQIVLSYFKGWLFTSPCRQNYFGKNKN